MKSNRDIKVCVLGAGVCGIVSVKACLDAGFEVTCFDKSPQFGGLWNFQDDKEDLNKGFVPTIMKTTILNTSKELSAFSDFPPPPQLPNYMKHNLYMDYIKSYVEHFKIRSSLKLKHEVLHCELNYNKDREQSEWLIDVKDLEENKVTRWRFDKLMIAVGHHNIPHVPSFPEQHRYKGNIIHTNRVKNVLNDDRFIDKRVLVIGFGNSACDLANDLALVTKKCYVSSHRGNWFVSRLTETGLYDLEFKTRLNYYRKKYFPNLYDQHLMQWSKSRVNHDLLGLTPKHKPSEQTPAINDLFPFRVFTGGITLKSFVSKFTEKGVIFEGEEEEEYEVDIVVLATGYIVRMPFLNEFELGLKSAEHDEYELYLNMFAPKLTVSEVEDQKTCSAEAIKSMAVIGCIQPFGSITVVSELQARLATLVFEGKCDLPGVDEMLKDIHQVRSRRSAAIRTHSRDQLVGSWTGYLDEIASQFGAKPNLSKLFFKDFALWKKLVFGPSVPYQYRLYGPGRWEKARETIMTVEDRVQSGINDGKNDILFKARRKCLKDRKDKEKSRE